MNAEYSNGSSFCIASSTMFIEWFPQRAQMEQDMQMKLKYRSKRDPEGPPEPESGDIYIVISTLVGIVVGTAVGAIIGNNYFNIIGGAIVGFLPEGLSGL